MKLNLRQKKILKLLSINCRFSNKDIAKSLKISEDSVAYQINKLIKKDKLADFSIFFFHPSVGYDSYHVWIRSKSKDISKLKLINEIHSINESHGKFNLQILVYAKSKRNLLEILRKIKKRIKCEELYYSKLQGMYKVFTNVLPSINVSVKIPTNPKKFEYKLNLVKDSFENLSKESYSKIKLDKADFKIIRALVQKPRASFQEIAELTKLNYETIRYRMKRFIQNKLITNFGLIHDFKKYGLYVNYFLLKLNEKKLDKKEFQRYINSTQNILYCPKLEGDYNCIVYVVSENPEEQGEIQEGLMNVLGNAIKNLDLLFFSKVLKYEHFPKILLG